MGAAGGQGPVGGGLAGAGGAPQPPLSSSANDSPVRVRPVRVRIKTPHRACIAPRRPPLLAAVTVVAFVVVALRRVAWRRCGAAARERSAATRACRCSFCCVSVAWAGGVVDESAGGRAAALRARGGGRLPAAGGGHGPRRRRHQAGANLAAPSAPSSLASSRAAFASRRHQAGATLPVPSAPLFPPPHSLHHALPSPGSALPPCVQRARFCGPASRRRRHAKQRRTGGVPGARPITSMQGVPDPASRQHLVLTAYYIALLWVLQSGDVSPGSDRCATRAAPRLCALRR